MDPSSVAAFILFIGILIFVHELGHFLAAKSFNIKVLKFSLGFGPPIFRFTKGETDYQIALLPLGGFVKMLGEHPGDEIPQEERHRAFNNVPVYQRAVVAFAGPFFNLVFPIICFFAYYTLEPTVIAPVVGQVEVDTPAEKAGLRPGDRVVEIDGDRVWDFERMSSLIRGRPGEPLKFKVKRGEKDLDIEVTPREITGEDIFGSPKTRGIIGVRPDHLGTRLGVDTPQGRALGFETGDRVLSVDGTRVKRLDELEAALRASAGKTVKVAVARPRTLQAGGLFHATEEVPMTLDVAIPPRADALADLGLASSDTFVRALDPNGPAVRAGLRPGDRILEVAGQRISSFYSFSIAVQQAEGKPLDLKVRRDGKDFAVTLKSDKRELEHEVTGKMRDAYDPGIGVGAFPRYDQTLHWYSNGGIPTEPAHLSVPEAFTLAVTQTFKVIGDTVEALVKLLSGGMSPKQVGGPIMLFQVASQAAEAGFMAYLQLLALISVNLGIINLVPVPIFDGGHLLFCAIEAIKRKPVSMRVREVATIAGLVLLAVLIVLVFSNDISRIATGPK